MTPLHSEAGDTERNRGRERERKRADCVMESNGGALGKPFRAICQVFAWSLITVR